MNHTLKGVLLSGLVLPGLGQVVQKRIKRGIVLMLVVVTALVVTIANAVRHARSILEKIEAGGVPPDLAEITALARQAVTPADQLATNLALGLVAASWLVGILDAYLTGRRLDREAGPPPETPDQSA